MFITPHRQVLNPVYGAAVGDPVNLVTFLDCLVSHVITASSLPEEGVESPLGVVSIFAIVIVAKELLFNRIDISSLLGWFATEGEFFTKIRCGAIGDEIGVGHSAVIGQAGLIVFTIAAAMQSSAALVT